MLVRCLAAALVLACLASPAAAAGDDWYLPVPDADQSAASAPSLLNLPLLGRFTARFGTPGSLWKLGYHTGLDIAAPMGTPIRSAADGVVIEAEMHSGYGLYAKVDHGGGVHTLYGHMRVLRVAPGDQVLAGDPLGEVGMTGVTTGPHLHWEVRRDGERVNPEKYLP